MSSSPRPMPMTMVARAPQGCGRRSRMPKIRGMAIGMPNRPVKSLLASKAPPKPPTNNAPTITSAPMRSVVPRATSIDSCVLAWGRRRRW